MIDIDIDKDGIQFGHLAVPHPTNRSAYGRVGVPIFCFKSGGGPTVTLTGAIHGDEIEGHLILLELIDELNGAKIDGRIIILPHANVLAFKEKTRFSTSDGLNLNRSFPGDRGGSYTQRLAEILFDQIITKTDYIIDLHSGGTSLEYLPSIVVYQQQLEDRSVLEMIESCELEHVLVFQGKLDGASLLAAAKSSNVAALTMELGGGASLNCAAIYQGAKSVRNLLTRLEVVRDLASSVGSCGRKIFLEVDRAKDFFHATRNGWFVCETELGATVPTGGAVGSLYEEAGRQLVKHEIQSTNGGVLVCRRALAETAVGDCIFHVGRKIPEPV